MTRYVPPDPTPKSVWKHKLTANKRAQVTQVTNAEVEIRIVFGPGSFAEAATVRRVSRRTWHTWWTPETPHGGGER